MIRTFPKIVAIFAMLVAITGVATAQTRDLVRQDGSLDVASIDGSGNHRFRITQPGLLTVEAVSLDFSPEIELYAPNDDVYYSYSTGRSGTILHQFVADTGDYEVVVYSATEMVRRTGSYSVVVSYDTASQTLQLGRTMTGTLSTNDSVEPNSGGFMDMFLARIPAGGRLTVTADSQAFPIGLRVYQPGAEPLEASGYDTPNTVLTVRGEPNSMVLISVLSNDSYQSGGYSIVATEPPPPRSISQGATIREYLQSSAPPEFEFVAPAADRYEINVRSEDFDTVLTVIRRNGEELYNDDYQGTNSRLIVEMAAGEVITVAPNIYYSSGAGEYELTLDVMQPLQTVSIGSSFNGTFDDQGYRRELEIVGGSAGSTVEIILFTSIDDYSASLELSSGGEAQYAREITGRHESERGLRLLYRFPGDSTPVVSISAWEPGGDYELVVRDYDGPTESTHQQGRPIDVGDEVEGFLDSVRYETQFNSPDFDLGDEYALYLEADQTVIIALNSDDFDAYLTVIDPNGRESYDDDGGGNGNSHLMYTAPTTGVYVVVAGSYGGYGGGVYRLAVRSAGDVVTILAESGQLSSRSAISERSSYMESYTVRLTAGVEFMFEAMSSDFDTFIIVRDAGGNPVASDDDGGSGTNSRLSFTPQSGGTYLFEVMAYSSSSTGAYEAVVREIR